MQYDYLSDNLGELLDGDGFHNSFGCPTTCKTQQQQQTPCETQPSYFRAIVAHTTEKNIHVCARRCGRKRSDPVGVVGNALIQYHWVFYILNRPGSTSA